MNSQSSNLSPEIAFIDAGVADSNLLISQFQPGTEVHLLDSSQDALDQITSILSSRSNISAVHILSHGSDGALLLGSKTVNDLSSYDAELSQWSNSLTADADILLYGCNVAADAVGKAFVNQLAQQTGADVAASDDLTGKGGDWDLEYSSGSIETTSLVAWDYSSTLANFTVSNTNDSGAGSLRDAIAQANSTAGADTISFSVSGTITLTSQLELTDSAETTINGAGSITVSGNNATRVFSVASGSAATLSGLTISGGRIIGNSNNGGGILNSGTLTVSNSTFIGNLASGGFGGGILNSGTLTVSSSTFTGNSASNPGGAIDNRGTMTVSNSTFTGNSASGGGAIDNNGTMTVSNSTFTGNSARGGGGIINQPQGRLTVSNSTFTGNSASDSGGGIFHGGVTLTVSNSIVAGNASPNGREIRSLTPVTSGGYNLFGFNGDSGLVNITTVGTDVIPTVDLSAILDTTLRDNGGSTQTLALVAGSPAINAGNTALTTDQRGIARPQGVADDIGAFESSVVASTVSFTAATYSGSEGNSGTTNQVVAMVQRSSSTDTASVQVQLAANPGSATAGTDYTNTLPLTLTFAAGETSKNIVIPIVGDTVFEPDETINLQLVPGPGAILGSQATATYTILNDDAPNTAPVATNDSFTTSEDTTLTVSAATGVLANDTDADSNALTASLVTGPTNGTLTLNPNGSFTYTPNANFNGSDSFTYRANDGTVNSNTATVTLNVTAVNQAPSFTKGPDQTVNEDSGPQTVNSWATNLSAGPANESAQTLSFQVSNNNNSLFSAQPSLDSTGKLTYTPAANANGTATVTVQLKDSGGTTNGGQDTSAPQTFTISVTAVNDAPVVNLTSTSQSILSKNSLISGLSVSDIDAGTSPVTVTLKVNSGTLNVATTGGVTIGSNSTGTVTLTGSISAINSALTNLRYSSTNNFSGNDSLSVTVNDNGNTGTGPAGGLSASKTVALSVVRDLGTLGAIGQIVSGSVNATDPEDLYQVTLTAGATLYPSLFVLTGDADLAILDSAGNVIASSNNPGLQAEVITRAVPAGVYRIRVRRFTGSTNYNLVVAKY